jgi:hypothetical protein
MGYCADAMRLADPIERLILEVPFRRCAVCRLRLPTDIQEPDQDVVCAEFVRGGNLRHLGRVSMAVGYPRG